MFDLEKELVQFRNDMTPSKRVGSIGFDLKTEIEAITHTHLAANGINLPERRKVSDHPALAETLIEKLKTQTALQDDVIKMLEKQLAEAKRKLQAIEAVLRWEK